MRFFKRRILMCATVVASATDCTCGGAPTSANDPDAEVTVMPDAPAVSPDMGVAPDSYIPSCGNGVRDPGEECDGGEENSDSAPDACRTDCTAPACGDEVVDKGEECDEGQADADDPDACRTTCELPRCGDALTDSGEECDDGAFNSDSAPDACRTDCVAASCGDGVWDSAEECDNGADNSDTAPDVCRTDCTEPTCGDGVTDTGEQCDQGEDNSNVLSDACRLSCILPSCGDGVLDTGEQCEGAAINPCVPACGSAGIQNCSECVWGACGALDTICDDEDPCTVDDHCEGEICATDPLVCTSPLPDECIVDGLTRRTYAAIGFCSGGVCSYATTDTVCNDANACTSDGCTDGACAFTGVVCDDAVVCTDDTCDSAIGCVFTPQDSACNDNNLCTDDSCDAADGCVNVPNTLVCDDGDACTTDDVCTSASCAGESVVCNEIPASECVAGPAVRTYGALGTCAGGVCDYPVSDEACTAPSNGTATCAAAECGSDCNFGYTFCYGAACCVLDWTATFASGLAARVAHSAIWTGSEMIVFGGTNGGLYYADGVRYVPLNDGDPPWGGWTATASAVSVRRAHTAVWTGSEMIVWGGSGVNLIVSGKGEAYDPISDSWITLSDLDSPSERKFHTAIWTGSQMIIWGGLTNPFAATPTNTGGRYDQVANAWIAVTTDGAPQARFGHTAVWTGSEMIVWGGYDRSSWLNTGGIYDPVADEWTSTSMIDAPAARDIHTAVWTGSEMIVWGGRYSAGAGAVLNTGGRYDPVSDTWATTSTVDAPAARYGATEVWTGNEMIVWGGTNFSSASGLFRSGGRYDPLSDLWDATSLVNAPMERGGHTAVWTDFEMIVWGGWNDGTLNTGGRYTPP